MGNYVEKSSQLNCTYSYDNDYVIVNGSYAKNADTQQLISVHGDVYTKVNGGQGAYIGNFNGTMNGDNQIDYDLSAMSRADSNKVWDAIDEIEPYITGENAGEE